MTELDDLKKWRKEIQNRISIEEDELSDIEEEIEKLEMQEKDD